MKKVVSLVLIVCLFLAFSTANAQDTTLGQKIKHGAKSTGHAIGKGASAVGKKTAEVASKGSSKVIDKTYKGKQGPDGQTIYIDSSSKYYWVDKSGHRHYVTSAQIKDKAA